MPNSTPSGWPYVEGPDLATQYPITSEALADKLESSALAPSGALWTATAPWVVSTGALHVSRTGNLVVIEGIVKPTSSQTLTLGSNHSLGTAPPGYRPPASQTPHTAAVASLDGAAPTVPMRLSMSSAGAITARSGGGGTMTTAGYIAFQLAFRGE